ncbi:MAG: pantoate--beta-alanine ligase [Sediminibacterium sp.]|jgi:pantoate--beta-alanine ligase|nr:pantoate--beta-alanine ligase [Sediminibacterium sp.]MBX9781285.1 pantoate--beta-alanine ligase [Chitinophagaceae bacterium]
MIILKKIALLKAVISQERVANNIIGFIPTMGALHEGHLTLVKKALDKCNFVIVSIYVNPTQFNNQEDFKKYPITLEEDLLNLTRAGCHAVFLPDTDELYPDGIGNLVHYPLGFLETILEGEHRPGHFQGVSNVVDRLLQAVNPDYLFLGEKDAQQCKVIAKMLALTNQTIPLEIIPTMRASSGLALSSRNKRLSAIGLTKAAALYESLLFVKKNLIPGDNNKLIHEAKAQLIQAGFDSVDYLAIAKEADLSDAVIWDGKEAVYILGAAYMEGVRLIDNTLFVG